MNDRDWVGELSSYLQQVFLRFCEVLGQPRSISELRLNPPLAIEEAYCVLLGLEAGLFRVDEEGFVKSELLLYPGEGNLKRGLCQIFALSPPPARIVRENICRLATISALVLQHGWLPGQIKMATGDTASYGVDIIVESVAGEILVCVEIKRSAHELRKFTSDFRQCCKRGEHAKADCAFQQNHDMSEFCARYEPPYLWIVAPGEDVCFKLSYANRMVEIEELETLARRSHIEFGSSQSSTDHQ